MPACVLCHRELPLHELDAIDLNDEPESALHICRGCANPSGVPARPSRRRGSFAEGAVLPWTRDFNPRTHCLGKRA